MTPRIGQAFQGTISAKVAFNSHEEIDAWLAARIDAITRDCNWRETSERPNATACWRLIDPTAVVLCQIEAGRRYRERVASIRAFCEEAKAEAYRQAADAHARLNRRLAEERARLVRGGAETPVTERTTTASPRLDLRLPPGGVSPTANASTMPTASTFTLRRGETDQERSPLDVGTPFTCVHPYQCDLYNYFPDGTFGLIGRTLAGSVVFAAEPETYVPYQGQLVLTNRIGDQILVHADTPSGPRRGWTLATYLRAYAAPDVTPSPPNPLTSPRERLPSRVPVPPSPLTRPGDLTTELTRPPYIPTDVIRGIEGPRVGQNVRRRICR